MPHGFALRDGWFLDPRGRHVLFRGVNVGGSSKVPRTPDGATWRGVDFEGARSVSFVGRPFPLAEADRHLSRLRAFGFDLVRLVVPWEAIAHAGPETFDEAYLDYVRALVAKARTHGILVFVDPHQDVWSRFSGGDGAPLWTFEWAGLRPERFVAAQAVWLDDVDWPQNALGVPSATMWTLFLAGDRFCPELRGVQGRLQEHRLRALCALAERLRDLDNVLGYDTGNEPSVGYLGQTADALLHGEGFTRGGPRPFSALDLLAAADGLRVETATGRVLDPQGVSIWKDGCPWRRLGVWDVDAAGRPVLLAPDYFRVRDGVPFDVWRDALLPYVRRFRAAVRRVQLDAVLFLEGVPGAADMAWDDPDPLVCSAPHWYDLRVLQTLRFDPAGDSREARVARYAAELASLQATARERMGGIPVLLGETGIPYDLNGGEAFRTGDWSAQEELLGCIYDALDARLLGAAQWNYTADNDHAHGDQWNREDFSVFSRSDQHDPEVLESGGRATTAFCRPRLSLSPGRPLRMRFDRASRRFEATIAADPAVRAPAVVFAPLLHYPGGPEISVSTGTARYAPGSQTVVWDLAGAAGEATIRLARRA